MSRLGALGFIAVAGTVLYASCCPAAPAPGPHAYGPGAVSCAVWTTDQTNPVRAAADVDWALGYVTAYNEYVAPGGDVMGSTDYRGARAWLGAYCQAHPFDSVSAAVEAFLSSLQPRKTWLPPFRFQRQSQ
jgi:hypothetical protein